MAADTEPYEHGTRGRYQRGCRCAPCQEAERQYRRQWQASVRATGAFSHGLTGYVTHRCRCSICMTVASEYYAARRARQRVEQGLPPVGEREPSRPQHGSRERYVHGRCRCDACRAANAKYFRQLRDGYKERLATDPTIAPHGVLSTYRNYGCRCELCIAANTARSAAQRASGKQPGKGRRDEEC